MKNIDQLSKEEQQHYILCECGSYIDMRDLNDVFSHLHFAKKPNAEWPHSMKKGEPAAYPRQENHMILN